MNKQNLIKVAIAIALIAVISVNVFIAANCDGKVVRGVFSFECLP